MWKVLTSLGCFTLVAFTALLGLRSLGWGSALRVGPLFSFDVALVVGAPFLLALCLRHGRDFIRSPIFLGAVGISFFILLGKCLRANSLDLRTLADGILILPLVLWAVCTCHVLAPKLLLRTVLISATVVAGGSLLGYGAMVMTLNEYSATTPFIFASDHPVFHGLPRLSGTADHSPQRFGQYLVVAMAVALHCLSTDIWPRLSKGLLGLGTMGLFLTFSTAWIGGLVLFTAWITQRFSGKRARPAAWCMLGVAVISIAWMVNIGRPVSTQPSCEDHDFDHHLVALPIIDGYADPELCVPIYGEVPYRHHRTGYAHAKLTSLAALTTHPFFGVGENGFGPLFVSRTRVEYGVTDDHAIAPVYPSPHGLLLGIPAIHGLFVTLCALVVFWGWLKLSPSTVPQGRWLWMGCLALLLIGLNIDVHLLRHGWLLLGLLWGHSLVASREDPHRETT